MIKFNKEGLLRDKKVLAGLVIVLGFFLINALLAVSYQNSFLPNSKVNNLDVSGMTVEQVASALQDSLATELTVAAIEGDESIDISLEELGYEIDQSQAIEELEEYRAHAVPLFGVLGGAGSGATIMAQIDDETLSASVGRLKIELDRDPFGQQIQVGEDGSVTLLDGTSGVDISIEDATETLAQAVRDGERSVILDALISEYDESARLKNADEAIARAEAILGDNVIIQGLQDDRVIDLNTRIQWIDISYEDDEAIVDIDASALNEFIESAASSVDSPVTETVITTFDSVVTETQEGVAGQVLDTDLLRSDIISALLSDSDRTVSAVISDQEPQVEYIRRYSDNEIGLQAKITDWVADTPGRYGVAIQQLDNGRWSGSANAETPFVAASTYKLFVIYAVLDKVETGEISLNDRIKTGMTVRQAIDDAIIYSGNESAIGLAEFYGGWDLVDIFIAENGFASTITDNYDALGFLDGDKMTTAIDLANFLERLNSGTLLNSENTTIMLNAMRQQIYRDGVNSGVNGEVASKVGFLEGFLHDAAIVYDNSTDYVMVILTDDSTWGDIADLAEVVDGHFN